MSQDSSLSQAPVPFNGGGPGQDAMNIDTPQAAAVLANLDAVSSIGSVAMAFDGQDAEGSQPPPIDDGDDGNGFGLDTTSDASLSTDNLVPAVQRLGLIDPPPIRQRAETRHVKMPQWRKHEFSAGSDFNSHAAVFMEELSKHEGLSDAQCTAFFLESLEKSLRPLAVAHHIGQGYPLLKTVIRKLSEMFRETASYEGKDGFEEALNQLVQKDDQSLKDYLYKVQTKLQEFKRSPYFSKANYQELEKSAYYALTTRLNGKYRQKLSDRKAIWESNKENPLMDKERRYFHVLQFLTQLMTEESASSAKRKAQGREICLYGLACTRKDCPYTHVKNKKPFWNANARKETPRGVGKKGILGRIPRCEGCDKLGHTKDKCWVANPNLRPKKQ
jgi:hypothetical protein